MFEKTLILYTLFPNTSRFILRLKLFRTIQINFYNFKDLVTKLNFNKYFAGRNF